MIAVRFYVRQQNFFFSLANIISQAKYQNLKYISQVSGNFSGKLMVPHCWVLNVLLATQINYTDDVVEENT